jgi:hypothetical protein
LIFFFTFVTREQRDRTPYIDIGFKLTVSVISLYVNGHNN